MTRERTDNVRRWSACSQGPAQTRALAAAVASEVRAGDLVALVGELGAGKTQFVHGLAEALGASPGEVASPTYVMVHEYAAGPDQPTLVHVDAYRLRSLEDLESIGWDMGASPSVAELFEDAVVVVEWADRLGDLLGADRLEVTLAHVGGDRRQVTVQAHGAWEERWPRLRELLAHAGGAAADEATEPCPICGAPAPASAPTFPFCSRRCRMVDLGRWLGGEYRVSRPIEQTDLDED